MGCGGSKAVHVASDIAGGRKKTLWELPDGTNKSCAPPAPGSTPAAAAAADRPEAPTAPSLAGTGTDDVAHEESQASSTGPWYIEGKNNQPGNDGGAAAGKTGAEERADEESMKEPGGGGGVGKNAARVSVSSTIIDVPDSGVQHGGEMEMDLAVQARWSSDGSACDTSAMTVAAGRATDELDREHEIREDIRLEQEGIKQAQDTAMMQNFTSLRPMLGTTLSAGSSSSPDCGRSPAGSRQGSPVKPDQPRPRQGAGSSNGADLGARSLDQEFTSALVLAGNDATSHSDELAGTEDEVDPNTPWTDDDFKPNDMSLCYGNFGAKPGWQKYVWRRLTDIYPDAKVGDTIFKGRPDENDICQGALADCYFLSALSALAEAPERIEEHFTTKTISKSGRYEIKFYKMGLPITVAVDDYFPCVSATGGPAFSYSPSHEPWVMLWEKAWAKLHGSYLRIETGWVGNALGDITGAPHVDVIWRDSGEGLGTGSLDLDATWDQLVDADKAGLPMAAAMPEVKHKDMEAEWGLVEGHAYTILGTKLLAGGTVKMVELRNPWGGGTEWKGKYSDHSNAWTEALKAEAKFEAKEDGRFHVEFGDFALCFSEFCILNLRTGWSRVNSKRFKVKPSGRAMTIILKVQTPTKAVISIHKRDLRQLEVDSDYGITRFEVFRLNGGGTGKDVVGLEHSHSTVTAPSQHSHTTVTAQSAVPEDVVGLEHVVGVDPSNRRDTSVEVDLAAGFFRVVVWGTFPGGKSRDCTLSVYSEHLVALGMALGNEKICDIQLSEAYAEKCIREGDIIDAGDRATAAGIVVRGLKSPGSFSIVCQNGSADRICTMTLEWSLTNCVLCGFGTPAEHGDTITIMVKPGESKVCRIRPDKLGETWGYQFSRQFALERDWSPETVALMRTQTKETGTVRDYKDNPGITCTTLKFDSGISILYENNAQAKQLDEMVTFKVKNLAIISDRQSGTDMAPVDHTLSGKGPPSDKVQILLPPNSARHLLLATITPGGWSYGLSLTIAIRDV